VGFRGIGVSGSGYNEVLLLEVLNVVDCLAWRRSAELLFVTLGFSLNRCSTVLPDVLACVHMYVYVYLCMYVFVRTYICMHECICMYTMMYTCIYMCIRVCTHICV